MKSRLEILKEIQKNLTYESIRFNNKQISDEIIKSAIDEFFPRVFYQEKWKEITYFTKAMKDEEFYKKIRALVSLHLSLESHLQEIQQRQNEKSKIQDSESHCAEQMNNRKMTRAALAKRNQQTQQQLRKDQIYVRLTPKTQQCLQWMLCNRNFPRIQCKLSCNQHIQYLITYLQNKWLRGKGHNKIVLYPDVGSYLKNSLTPKEREKILKEPLNNYFMFTDVMVGCGIGQNGILNLHYDIMEKKKDTIKPLTIVQYSVSYTEKSINERKLEKLPQNPKNVINVQEVQNSNKRANSNFQEKQQQKLQNYTPVNATIKQQQLTLQKPGFPSSSHHKHQSSLHHHSNNFLSNESNLLNPNRSIYHDDESLFKSIGFFALGGNVNSIGFGKKNDFHLMSINSNSLLNMDNSNQKSQTDQKQELKIGNVDNEDKKNDEKQVKSNNQASQKLKIEENSSSEIPQQKVTKQEKKLKENVKTKEKIKPSIVQKTQQHTKLEKRQMLASPQKQSNNHSLQRQKQHSKSNQKSKGFSEFQQSLYTKKPNQNLLDLRKAINLLQQVQGFNDPQPKQQEISQKSIIREIKTVSVNIKKKTTN